MLLGKINFKTIISILMVLIALALLQSIVDPLAFVQESNYLFQPFDTKGLLKGLIYSSVYIFCLLAIVLALFTKNRMIATVLILFVAMAYAADILVQLIGSSEKGISIALFSFAMVEKTRVNDMMLFKSQFIQAAGFMLLFIVAIILARTVLIRRFRVSAFLSIPAVILAMCLSAGSVFAIFSVVAQSYPAPIKIPAIVFEYIQANESQEPRVLAESLRLTNKSKLKTIVWIIDESVGGQYLSVNGFEKETTPYLKALSHDSPDMINYGVVPSMSNCSASANLLLRIGLTNNLHIDFKSNLNKLPTIYQFAKRAGFKTTLIDAQAAKGQLQNRLTATDALELDNFITLDRNFIPNQRDNEALNILNTILNEDSDQANFVVVIKWGSHWPYPLTYQEEIFKPAARESYTEINEENKELVLNAYYNSLRFAVDDFLKKLIENNVLENQIIFYTSDHGQNLYQDSDPLTHCYLGENLRIDEYKVPLMAFSKDIKNILSKPSVNANAQEQLFATTLKLMGYSNENVKAYGPTLSEGVQAEKINVNLQLTGQYFQYKPDQK